MKKNVQAPRDVVRKLYRRADSRIMECEGWRFQVAGTKAQLCGCKQHIFSCAGGISRFLHLVRTRFHFFQNTIRIRLRIHSSIPCYFPVYNHNRHSELLCIHIIIPFVIALVFLDGFFHAF